MTADADVHRRVVRETIALQSGPRSTAAVIDCRAAPSSRRSAGGGKLLLFGNGGSAADAQHVGRGAGRAVSSASAGRCRRSRLTTDTSVLTQHRQRLRRSSSVFARQIEALGTRRRRRARHLRPAGARRTSCAPSTAARSRGLQTVALTGRDGGPVGRRPRRFTSTCRRTRRRACRKCIARCCTSICEIVERDACGVARRMPELRTETMTVNMGPQHPSTHGVLRLVLELDGETVALGVADDRLSAHRHREDRRAEEVAAGHPAGRADGLPERAVQQHGVLPVGREAARDSRSRSACSNIRVLLAELQRINSHLVWLGTHGMEVGAVSVMLYCFRERELLLNINEMLAGFRMFPSYMRVGGLREDLPRGFHDAVRAFLDRLPPEARRVRRSADARTRSTSKRTQRRRRDLEGDGRRVRPGRSDRRARPASTTTCARRFRISATRPTSSTVPTQTDRRRLRALSGARRRDAREREDLPPGARADLADRRVRGRRSADHAAAEGSRLHRDGSADPALPDLLAGLHRAGRRGATCRSKGRAASTGSTSCRTARNRPWRIKSRAPSLLACQALEQMIVGGLIADVIAVIGSIDVVMGDVDR